jgi:hypothetical protein
MSVTLLYPPGPLYAQYRGVEDALGVAQRMHERQLALRASNPGWYDPDMHAIVLAFNLRVIARKLDALVASFRATIHPNQDGGVSERTSGLLNALQQYNAAVACRDASDNSVDALANVLDMAFDCLALLEGDIQAFES